MFNLEIRSELNFAHTLKVFEKTIVDAGFKILHIHDLQKILNKNGFESGTYQIFEFCMASMASKLLKLDPLVGLFLPCKAVLYKNIYGGISIGILRPDIVDGFFDDISISEIIKLLDMKIEKLSKVLVGKLKK